MGNQGSGTLYKTNNRRRSLPTKQYEESKLSASPSPYPRKNIQTINQSLDLPSPSTSRQYRSIDLDIASEQKKSIRSERISQRQERQGRQQDRMLQKLSEKNEELRRQLKKISDELTQQIKKKRFIPKKKVNLDQEEDMENKNQANAGLRRQLQNGYKQIDMYKRTILTLKGKNQQHQTDVRIKRLQNTIASTDAQINLYIKKTEGVRNIKKGQDKIIEKDINEDLKGGVLSLKRQVDELKKVLKEYTKRDRQRDVNYKKQQAYQFEVEKKYREVNGDYFPELKKKGGQLPNPINSRVTHVSKAQIHKFTVEQFIELQQQISFLKGRHEEYNKKIDAKVQQKNKLIEEHNTIEQNIKYSERVIEALKLRLKEVNKISKPTKKSLFGYDSYNGEELQNEYNGGRDEIEKQIEEQNYQDQFDIKHLIANIPKPAREKVVIEFSDNASENKKGIPREISADKKGMFISGEKAQPKKWGSSLTRSQQKGRGIKKETPFDDANNLPPDVKPLIIGVNIWVNKNNGILGLQAIYLVKDEIRYGIKSSSGSEGFLQRYDLQSPDYLKNITGAFSEDGYLEYLVFYSKQGKINTFGLKAEGQEQFHFGMSSTERPFRLSGASFVFDEESRINRLGIEICQQQ